MTKFVKPDQPLQHPGSKLSHVGFWSNGDSENHQSDALAEERAVALVYNGISHAVMMLTPQDLKDFALGFSFTEGIIDSIDQVYDVSEQPCELGTELHIELSAECFAQLKQRRRTLAGNTGCGLCGTESLEQVFSGLNTVQDTMKLSHQTIQTALATVPALQQLQAVTGAVHGVAWCDTQGEVHLLREDVGRHNALDKLIGARLLEKELQAGFAVISSRASYEMVQKAAKAGIGILVAVSAATSLAVEIAEKTGITLIGFGREGRHVIYTHPQRLCD